MSLGCIWKDEWDPLKTLLFMHRAGVLRFRREGESGSGKNSVLYLHHGDSCR